MHRTVQNLNVIKKFIISHLEDQSINKIPKIIAVSKTFSMEKILPLIEYGHIDFGENKVQEAIEKWQEIKKDFNHLQLHMIGKLQTNKVKFAVPLFDYIHSLDSLKLAKKISEEQNKIKKRLKIFIQINIGNEEQKNGIDESNLNEFYNSCVNDLDLDIIGLMCLPPKENESKKFFLKMKNLAENLNIHELSMGMSNDYLDATNNGSTFLRIGTKIFGNRG